jgi:tetratricopeptide (TPR) repeat protein
MLCLKLSLLFCLFSICFAEEGQNEFKLPDEKVIYDKYEDADLVKITELLNEHHRHSEAVEACNKALSRNLTESQRVCVIHAMATAYENIPNRGQEVKDTYLQIINKYPNYEKLPYIAYRLGELNCAIIPPGTKPDTKKAIECLKLVIRRLPVEPNKDNPANMPDITYLSLEAHMMLGNVYLDEGLNDEAGKCFKTIFDCDINKAAPLPYEKFKNDKERQEHMKWLKERITKMKTRTTTKMVVACISSDIGESMQRIAKLQSDYPDNVQIRELASIELEKMNKLEEIIKSQIENPDTK